MQPYGISNLQYFQNFDLSKGLITNQNPAAVGPEGSVDTTNFIWHRGYLRPRAGFASYPNQISPAGPILHIGSWTTLSGTNWIVLVSSSGTTEGRVWSDSGSGFSLNLGVAAGLNPVEAEQSPSCCTFNNEYVVCLGETEARVFSPSMVATNLYTRSSASYSAYLHPPSNPRLCASNSSHLFFANVIDRVTSTRVPYRLHWSDTLNSNVWNGGVNAGTSGIVDLADEQDAITALYVQNENLLVFKRKAIYQGQFVGAPLFYTFRRSIVGVGCINHNTLRRWRNDRLVWLGDDGVYVGGIGQAPQRISDSITSHIQTNANLDLRRARALIDQDNDIYYLYLRNVANTETTVMYALDLVSGAWWYNTLTTGFNVTAAYDDPLPASFMSTRQLVGTYGGALYDFDLNNPTDAGTNFTCTWDSGYIPASQLTRAKYGADAQQITPQTVRVFAPSSAGAITVGVNGYLGFDRTYNPIPIGTQTADGVADLYIPGRSNPAEFIQMHISMTGAANRKIAGYEIGYMPQGDTHRRR